ncbi:hypothetical protein SAMN04488505_108223 [Chitinophaga rupis]|uniref:Outer membrane protein beta-barrel domain-containing protein n=1 Tax=Chitinophaga rupis TaxID=573321 RepID=A0A1H8E8V1_9BACT|nr:hypothetical protein [Chitinophaga rupis]SEN15949.1 hypothetical protein SAMN04488505_108223 [Chitinophaga rupis]
MILVSCRSNNIYSTLPAQFQLFALEYCSVYFVSFRSGVIIISRPANNCHSPNGRVQLICTQNWIVKNSFISLLLLLSLSAFGQTKEGSFFRPFPANYEVKQAIEVESLFPMFFTGGYHIGIGYRYRKFRIRASVINGGTYNAEPAGVSNSSSDFKRFYKTSPGFFLGYNAWKNLEVYAFLEHHTFQIEQKSTGQRQDLTSVDFGPGIGYQFFIGRYLYIQPAFHVYIRANKSETFPSQTYKIPNIDLSPVIRIGCRLWKQFPSHINTRQ